MIRLSRAGLAAAAALALALAAGPLAAQKPKAPTLGTVERLDKALDAVLPEDAAVELLVDKKFQWVEGPIWDKAHNRLLFSDTQTNTAWQWSPTAGVKEFLKPSGYTGTTPFTGKEPGSNGMTMTKAGELILCQHGDRRVARLVDHKFITLADKYMGKRLNSPNDVVVKSNGDVYFTDPPYGLPGIEKDPNKELDFQGVYRVTPGGEITLLTKELTRPNGLAFSPDEKTLYVANSDPDKSVLMAYSVKADGTLGEGKVFFDTTAAAREKKPGLPDGLKVEPGRQPSGPPAPAGVYIFDPRREGARHPGDRRPDRQLQLGRGWDDAIHRRRQEPGPHPDQGEGRRVVMPAPAARPEPEAGARAAGPPAVALAPASGSAGRADRLDAAVRVDRVPVGPKGSATLQISRGDIFLQRPRLFPMTPTRRDFVRAALAAPFLATGLRADEPARPGFPGLILRAREPRNLEFPLSELQGPIIANEQFYVRNHFAMPRVDPKTWRLKVEGAVERPLELTYDELTRLPRAP